MLVNARSAAIASLATLLLPLAAAIPCVQFDASWNLYAFGGSSDVALGSSSSWGSPNPQTLTTTGRPPWSGKNAQCFLSQYNNAMYVLNADASDASKLYIYSFASSSWSTQSTSSAPSGLSSASRSASVLDHDTNVFFTLVGDTLYQLDLSSVTSSASSSAVAWQSVENPSFSTSSYSQVTAAQASNHIAYFGVPGTAAGSANMFVIHYSYFQPTAQAFPTQNGGSTFPDTPGQAVSVPDAQNNAGSQMVFVPNDFSSTYLVSHWTNPSSYASTSGAPFATSQINTTQTLPAPSSQDTGAAYAASPSSLVQIDSSGNIYYIATAINNYQVASGASWTKMSYSLSGTGTSNTNSSSVASSSSSSASASASGSGSSTGSSSASRTGSASSAASSGASATSSGGAAAASTSKSAASALFRSDVAGLVGGVAAVLGALLF